MTVVNGMMVTLQLRSEAAAQIRARGSVDAGSKQLLNKAKELGVTIEPMHPNVGDTLLGRFFQVRVPDRVMAERVISELRQLPATEAAYLKPAERPPSL